MTRTAPSTAATTPTTIAPSRLGPLPLSALTNHDVAAWLNGLPGSAKTQTNKHGFLSGALNAPVRARQIWANPCDGNRMRRDAPSEMVCLTHEHPVTGPAVSRAHRRRRGQSDGDLGGVS